MTNNTINEDFDIDLTLGEEPVNVSVAPVKPKEYMADIRVDLSKLSPQEIQKVDQFVERINISDYQTISNYGAGAQKKMSDFSSDILSEVKAKDMDEIGEMLSSVAVNLREIDEKPEKKGLLGLFGKGKNAVETLRSRYDSLENNVNNIALKLEDYQIQLLRDNSTLDQMYKLNSRYYKELTLYILAGKKKVTEVRNVELPKLREIAEASNDPEDLQNVNNLIQDCDRFEKKIYDLELSRTLSLQTAPQLRLLQANNTVMCDKIHSTLVNTIPLWKNQLVISLGVSHATQAAKAQNAISETTNELLRRNAEALHSATVETARESNRGIIDLETLKETNNKLIQTFDEVMQIQNEGRQKRIAAEKELQEIEDTLKKKILELSK